MVQFAIRCQRTVPLDPDELERWLEQRVRQLRPAAPTGTLRVSRITQALPSGAVDVGWLLEFELPESELPRIDRPLADALTDMRLLGFQPTVLAPVDASHWRACFGVGNSRPGNGAVDVPLRAARTS
jgi:hypothetical protein